MPLNIFSFDWISDWAQASTAWLVFLMFVNILWIPFMIWAWKEMWESVVFWTNSMSKTHRKPIYLAIDVPGDIEQTPVAMEAIFCQLAGAHGTETWWESNWEGRYPEWFSLEIVSLDGYVQYIIVVDENLRDLVEASIYAQYPDAEISEVKDYTPDMPSEWPNEEWDCFGMELVLKNPSAYPLRTYREFEDKVRGEYVDPLAALLEIMSKIGKGEQIWYQILIRPIVDSDWVPEAQKEIDKLIEKKMPPAKKSIFQKIISAPNFLIDAVNETFFPEAVGGGEEKADNSPRTAMMTMTPGEKTLVEDMENKTSKIAYKTKMRIFYAGRHDVIHKPRGISPVVGAIKQFNDASKNYFFPAKSSWTKANYLFKKARVYQRQKYFVNAYKSRSMYGGEPAGFVLNTEELATIYHFPMSSVKAPLVKRTGAKKSEPPATLPIDMEGGDGITLPEPPGGFVSASQVESKSVPEDMDIEKLESNELESVSDRVTKGLSENIVDGSRVQVIEIPDISNERNNDSSSESSGLPPSNLPIG